MSRSVYPKPLKKNARIAIVSPAGAVESKDIEKGLSLLREKGYVPVLGEYALGKYTHGYTYAGTEKERISDLNWAFNDASISAIWATRGGYGSQQLLRHLRLSRFRKLPKWYIGYSDNTVIQSFLLKNGFVSVYGQTLKTSSFGVDPGGYEKIFSLMEKPSLTYEIQSNLFNRGGKAKGILVGGNLSLIYALLGTRYSFDFHKKILFIEDIGENYYALDRMLISLDLAGVFRKIKGMIVGGMTLMGSKKDNPNYADSFDPLAYDIVKERVGKYVFPVAFGFPNGHIYRNFPLLIGVKVSLSVGEKVVVKF
ncbi:MAG: LD-carboxypeptidase [Bergeyella sp.]|nr:LD-carboxypeptidase [Bergeyella sp.]